MFNKTDSQVNKMTLMIIAAGVWITLILNLVATYYMLSVQIELAEQQLKEYDIYERFYYPEGNRG
tara:strand:- start:902 stop:1096 length:195 start_codon:yes stop_codon:yes gene_type:complete